MLLKSHGCCCWPTGNNRKRQVVNCRYFNQFTRVKISSFRIEVVSPYLILTGSERAHYKRWCLNQTQCRSLGRFHNISHFRQHSQNHHQSTARCFLDVFSQSVTRNNTTVIVFQLKNFGTLCCSNTLCYLALLCPIFSFKNQTNLQRLCNC